MKNVIPHIFSMAYAWAAFAARAWTAPARGSWAASTARDVLELVLNWIRGYDRVTGRKLRLDGSHGRNMALFHLNAKRCQRATLGERLQPEEVIALCRQSKAFVRNRLVRHELVLVKHLDELRPMASNASMS